MTVASFDEWMSCVCVSVFQVGVLLNDGNPNRTRQHMKEIIHLETLIAQITVSSAERRDEEKLYHALTIADLATLAPFVSTFF